MKKIFYFFLSLIFIISFNFNLYINASYYNLEKDNESFKSKLEKEENGKLYIKRIDEIVGKMNKENLEKTSHILEKIFKSYDGKYINLLNYLKYKIDINLIKLETNIDNIKINFDFEGFTDEENSILYEISKERLALFIYSLEKLKLGETIEENKKYEIIEDNAREIFFEKLSNSFPEKFFELIYIEEYLDNIFIDYMEKNYPEIYEEQMRKVRDSIRISDLNKLNSYVKQYYLDFTKYPESLSEELLSEYTNKKFPKDELEGKKIGNCEFGYKYELITKNGVKNSGYRISTCLESKSNILITDNGIYDNKFEIGNF